MGTTSSTTPATFNGTSTYAGDLQNAITQAVNIASAPLNQLNANVSTLQGQNSELSTLQTDFSAIQAAIQNLDQATNGGNLTATNSTNTVASVAFDSSSAVAGGTYTLNVTNPGAPHDHRKQRRASHRCGSQQFLDQLRFQLYSQRRRHELHPYAVLGHAERAGAVD